MSYDFKEIRKLIEAAFTEEDFREFCFDHFRDVERDFTQGQTQTERVLMLIRYAETRGELKKLLQLIEKERPQRYREFRPLLMLDEKRVAGPPKRNCYLIAPRTDKRRNQALYDLLVPIIKEELRCEVEPKSVESADDFEMLANADMVIADITEKDPNVIYQVAVAHCLGQLVIVVGDNVAFGNYQELPFNVIQLNLGPSDELRELLNDEVLNIKKACRSIMENPIRRAFNAPLTELSPASGLVLGYYGNFVHPVAQTICKVMLGDPSHQIEVDGASVSEKNRKQIKLDLILPQRLEWANDAFIKEHLLDARLISRAEIKSGARSRGLYALPKIRNDGAVHLADIFPTFMTVLAKALDDRFFLKAPNERAPLWFRAAKAEIENVGRQLQSLIHLRNEAMSSADGTNVRETKKVIQVLPWNHFFPGLDEAS
jgi:Effector-associated domain 7